MPPKNYRVYRLDGAGRLHDAEWFEAENDEKATRQIAAKHPDCRSEVWQGTRLVAALSPKPFDPDDPKIQQAVADRLLATSLRLRRADSGPQA